MLTAVLLIASLGIILLAAELFTNAVEWVGHKLRLNEGVVGSILAAVGTAMPETLIPIVAILYIGDEHGEDVGIGAILGAPFMLATLAMFITGLAVVLFARGGRRTNDLRVNSRVLGRDIRFFIVAYIIVIAVAFVPYGGALGYWVRIAAAIAVIGVYVYYVYKHATDVEERPADTEGLSPAHAAAEVVADPGPAEHETLAPLHFHRAAEDPNLALVVIQLFVSLGIMLGGAYLFVEEVNAAANAIGVPALILSLLIAPIATELPEKFNSILWVRQSKDTLALGNLTGAMVFQSAIPAAFGIVFTEWVLTPENVSAFVSAVIAVVAAGVIFGSLSITGRKLTAQALLIGGVFYLLYVGYLFVVVM
jgi:cation:H+ antiporter